MTELLVKITPLDIAVVLSSPMILALSIFVLGSKKNPKAHLLAFLFGSLLIGIGVAILGFVLGSSTSTGARQHSAGPFVDIILGALFIVYGLKIIFSKEKKISAKNEEQSPQLFKWFGFGLLISATNLDTVFLSFTASKEVANSAINDLSKWILLAVNIFFFTLPITLPLLLTILFPKISKPILSKMDVFLVKYSRYIVFIIFLLFGIYLLYGGIKKLL